MKKSNQLNVRLTPELRDEIERACELTGLDPSTVARACLQAFAETVARDGEIRLPLAVIAKKDLPRQPGVFVEARKQSTG